MPGWRDRDSHLSVRSDVPVHVSGDGRVVVWTTTHSIVYRQVVGQTAVGIGDLPGGIADPVWWTLARRLRPA